MMIEPVEFTEREQSDACETWVKANPAAFVLNVRSAADVMIHRVTCRHFYWFPDAEARCSTTNAKFFWNHREQLEGWARATYGYAPKVCACVSRPAAIRA
jgi:hypothetical protein